MTNQDPNIYLYSIVASALVAALVSLVVSLMNSTSAEKIAAEKNTSDLVLAQKRFDFEKQLAEQRLKFEQQQILFKKRFELAETVLSDAYQFERIMGWVRSPGSFGGEGQTRDAQESESDNVKRSRDSYFVPIERSNKEAEFISKMMARRFTCRTHFGNEMDKAFQDFHMAQQTTVTYAALLIRRVQDHQYQTDQLLSSNNKLEAVIWDMPNPTGGPNEVSLKLKEALEIVERLTKPILDLSQSPDNVGNS